MAYCESCGTEMSEGARYCPECGHEKGGTSPPAAPTTPPPAAETKEQKTKTKKKGCVVVNLLAALGLVALAVIVLVIVFGNGGSDSTYDYDVPRFAPTSPPKNHEVMYKVGGTCGRASMTYQNSQGGTEQLTKSLPWSKIYNTFKDGDFVYVSAQNERDRGSVYCEIFVDGRSGKKSSSSGAYVIAACSGSLGLD